MAHQIDTRLQYLNNAAHLLNDRSPHIAAFLQTRIDGLVSGSIVCDETTSNTILSDAQERNLEQLRTQKCRICHACGHMSSIASTEANVDATGPSEAPKHRDRPSYVCHACNSRTYIEPPVSRLENEKGSRKRIEKLDPKRSELLALSSTDSSPKPVLSSSAGISKRPKNKKGGSLSAMLAKSKQDAATKKTGFGLDLMDLMKGS